MYSTCPTDVIVCTWSSSIRSLPRLVSHILGMHWFLWMMSFLVLKSSCLFRSCNGKLGLWMNPHVRIPIYTHILYVICASLSVCPFGEGLLISGRGFSFQGGAFLHSGRGFKIKSPPFCSLRVDYFERLTLSYTHSFILTLIRYLISLLFFPRWDRVSFGCKKKQQGRLFAFFGQKCILSAIKVCNIKSIQTPSWLYLDSNSPSDFIFWSR